MSTSVVLLLLFLGPALPCPLRCHPCSTSVAKCEHISSLTEILTGLSKNTEKIILHHGNLTMLPSLSFARFPKLHFLSITECLVTSLTNHTFFTVHVNILKVLDLSGNYLISCMIEPKAFSGLLFLQELTLTNNSLDVLRRSWFSEMPQLQKLFLGMNKITYLPPRMFENLTKLDELVLSSNLIQYLPMDTFYGIPSLTKLDLSNNRIFFINHEVFQPLQALQHLLLFQNQLTILPVLPGSISFLFLHENPWKCTCQLVVSMESLTAKIQTPDVVTCNSPPNLVGHKVLSSRPEGCIFPSSSPPSSLPLSLSSPSNILNLSLLYGFLAGLLFGSIACLLCCYCGFPKYCHCMHSGKQTDSKKTFARQWSRSFRREDDISNVEPQILCSFPVVGNMAMGSCCGHICRTFKTCCTQQRTSTDLQKPLVAVLSMDTTGKPVVSLHTEGRETGCSAVDHSCHQSHNESIARVNEGPRCRRNGGRPPEQRSFNLEDALWEPPIQMATLDHREKTECVLGKCVDTQLGEWISHSEVQLDEAQSPRSLVRPNRTAVKAERDQNGTGEDASKRNKYCKNGFRLRTSRRRSARKRNMSYQRYSHSSQTSLMSPRPIQASDVRQRQEGLVDRRHPNQRTRNGESSSNTDIYPNACLLSMSKVNRKQRRKPTQVHKPFPTLTSSSSSVSSQREENNLIYREEPYIEKQTIAPLYGKKEKSCPPVDDTCQVGKMHHKSWKARKSPEGSDVVLERDSSTTEDAGTCPRGGCSKSDPRSVPQKVSSQRIATPKKTRRFLGVTRQSFTGTPHLTDHDPTLALPTLDHNAEQLLPGEASPSRGSPVLPPRFAVPHPEKKDVDRESTEEHLSSLALPLGSAATEKTVTMQLLLKKQCGGMDSVEVQGVKMVLDPSRLGTHHPQSRSIRKLDEEQTCVEGSLEMSSLGVVGQGFVDDNKDTVSLHSSVMRSDSCYDSFGGLHFKMDANMSVLERTHGQAPWSDGQGDVYEEIDTTVTSHCTLVQKMCQIDFPLVAEEERPSK